MYGTEYTQKEINEALEQEHPRELVPVTDEDGHGTMLASIACGSEDLQAGFTGAAPYAELLVVKLKPAKPYLKDFFYIPQEMPAYQENDIMAAIEYLEETARKLGRPLFCALVSGQTTEAIPVAAIFRNFLMILRADGAGVRLWQPEMRRMPDIIFTGKVMEIQWLR